MQIVLEKKQDSLTGWALVAVPSFASEGPSGAVKTSRRFQSPPGPSIAGTVAPEAPPPAAGRAPLRDSPAEVSLESSPSAPA